MLRRGLWRAPASVRRQVAAGVDDSWPDGVGRGGAGRRRPSQAVVVDGAAEKAKGASDGGSGAVRPVQPLEVAHGRGLGSPAQPRPTCWRLLVDFAVDLDQEVILSSFRKTRTQRHTQQIAKMMTAAARARARRMRGRSCPALRRFLLVLLLLLLLAATVVGLAAGFFFVPGAAPIGRRQHTGSLKPSCAPPPPTRSIRKLSRRPCPPLASGRTDGGGEGASQAAAAPPAAAAGTSAGPSAPKKTPKAKPSARKQQGRQPLGGLLISPEVRLGVAACGSVPRCCGAMLLWLWRTGLVG